MATEPDKVDSSVLGTLVVLGVFLMIGTCLGVNALVRTEIGQDTEAKATDATVQLRKVTDTQMALLTSGAGIEQHMKAVVSDLRRNPSSASPPAPEPTRAAPTDVAAPAVEGDGKGAKGEAAPAVEGDGKAEALKRAPKKTPLNPAPDP